MLDGPVYTILNPLRKEFVRSFVDPNPQLPCSKMSTFPHLAYCAPHVPSYLPQQQTGHVACLFNGLFLRDCFVLL